MDKLILGIVQSDQHPPQVKVLVLEKISSTVTNSNKNDFDSVIRTCLEILYPPHGNPQLGDDLVLGKVKAILESWLGNSLPFTVQFTQEFIHSNKPVYLATDVWNKTQNIRKLQLLLNVLRNSPLDACYNEFKKDIKNYLISQFFVIDDLSFMSLYSHLFLENPELIVETMNEELFKVVLLIIKVLSKGSPLRIDAGKNEPNHELHIRTVSLLFKSCVEKDFTLMKYAAGLIFKEISNHACKPSSDLATLLAHLRYDYLHSSFEDVLRTVPDISVACMLIQLFDWFSLNNKGSRNKDIESLAIVAMNEIESWIIFIIKYLKAHEKSSVVDPIIINKVSQICGLMYNPSCRSQALTVLSYMLMSCSKNPNPFHKILVDFPVLLSHLKGEGSKSATETYQALSELIYTLMYNFPGHEGLYEPLITALQGHPKPDIPTMTSWLNNFKSDNVSIIEKEFPGPVDTGLSNLGNTCYMNSIIQALFNLVYVKQKILRMTYKQFIQPVSNSLQHVFAFLHLSKRPKIEPKDLLRLSRPGWFSSGAQQDCSEYLKHLLDKLHQEDDDESDSKVDGFFTGEICATVECLHCHSCSNQKEAFNDLPVSFKDTETKCGGGSDGGGGSSLKGGDSSDLFESKKVHFQLNETSKETVKTSLDNNTNEPSRSSSSSSMAADIVPRNSGLSIVDLMNNYFIPELLRDSNQYHCNVCNSLQDAYKSMKISKFPKYLVITLKRFTYNVVTKQRNKILDVLQYPPEFSICNGCESCYMQLGSTENTVRTYPAKGTCEASKTYRLSSVIVHSGLTSDSGHYYTYSCRYTSEKGNWYLFNDEEVRLVADDCISNLAKHFTRDTPYLCIYEECENTIVEEFALPEQVVCMVSSDNKLYLQEKIRQEKSKQYFPLNAKYGSNKDKDDDNDDDFKGSKGGGPCSSTGGNSWGGARFVC